MEGTSSDWLLMLIRAYRQPSSQTSGRLNVFRPQSVEVEVCFACCFRFGGLPSLHATCSYAMNKSFGKQYFETIASYCLLPKYFYMHIYRFIAAVDDG